MKRKIVVVNGVAGDFNKKPATNIASEKNTTSALRCKRCTAFLNSHHHDVDGYCSPCERTLRGHALSSGNVGVGKNSILIPVSTAQFRMANG